VLLEVYNNKQAAFRTDNVKITSAHKTGQLMIIEFHGLSVLWWMACLLVISRISVQDVYVTYRLRLGPFDACQQFGPVDKSPEDGA
jgi:hypothetical protein